MRRTFFWFFTLLLLASCNEKGYEKTADGVMVRLKGGDDAPSFLKVQVVSDNIVRVQGLDDPDDANLESLVVVDDVFGKAEWSIEESDNTLKLRTASLTTEITLGNGQIKFIDKEGNVKLQEVERNSKTMVPFQDELKKLYRIRQVFDSPADEAFYGLGQHQNGEFNYKGLDVELQQFNIVAVVPFLYSSKNYGILWDNYSITRFGDPRTYENINTLILKDKYGKEGGLTATYHNASGEVVVEQQEDHIFYENLETVKNTPEGYTMGNNCKVVWEGNIASNYTGRHKFKWYVASYSKLWIDGVLVADHWRQCWNPWFIKFDIDFKEGESHHIKMEWIPDAGVSYSALTYLDSRNEPDQQKLSLWSESAEKIDYYFISGNHADEVIDGYRFLTGKAPIVPKWSLGFWQSRERYKNWNELVDVVKEYRRRNIPFDNIVLDWMYWPQDSWGDHDFDPQFFPEPEKRISEIHDLNAKIMISVWPKFNVGTENYKLFEENGWLFTKNVDLKNLDWVGPGYLSTFYDAFNPDARKAYWEGMNKKLYSKGIDAWWLDATEPDIHSNVSLAEKKSTLTPNYLGSGEQFFNAFSLLQSKGVYEGQRQTNPDKRVYILTRSSFAGQQRYGTVTWSGDIVSRWHDLSAQVQAGLNMALSGIPYWTTDIGGFDLETRYVTKDPAHLPEWRELNTRWFQFGAFCPIFRVHGKFPFREIWNIAPEGSEEYQSMVYYTQLRYRLMPYIYSLAGTTYHSNYTMMRPLIMDFGHDKQVNSVDNQFMLGPALMVCPVVEFQKRQREVYLPSGAQWYDFYTGKIYEGGQTIEANAPLGSIPLFVKAGSILPIGPEISYAMEPVSSPVKLLVFPGGDSEFTLYEDAGDNYNYEKGEFSSITLKLTQSGKNLVIGSKTGSFRPSSHTFEVLVAREGKPVKLDEKAIKTVDYQGEEINIEL
jgi:alpha-D-xyloside xylohydrolase